MTSAAVDLAHVPTPLEPMSRLAAHLGLPPDALWVKRDDCTGLAGGGNKARKLVRLCTDALRQGCDVLVTGGGPQSNHVRMTAAAACRLGLHCTAVLAGDEPEHPSGNIVLDLVLGADIVWAGAVELSHLDEAIRWAADASRSAGRTPYVIPVGGSSVEGARAYLDAADELLGQVADVGLVVVADGTGGTHAGLAAGLRDHTRVLGVDVGARPDVASFVEQLAAGVARAAGRDGPLGHPVVVHDQVGDGYGAPTDAAREALHLAARLEGLVLDPVYTAKAMAGLVAAARDGRIDGSSRTVFVHTGGLPGLLTPAAAAWATVPAS